MAETRIFLNKRIDIVTPGHYVVGAKTLATFNVNGSRFLLCRLDKRVAKRRGMIRLVESRSA